MAVAQQVSPEQMERYAEHNARVNQSSFATTQAKAQDEARQQPVVPLNTGKKYVFRSLPGTLRGFSVRIPTLPYDFRTPRQREFYTERFNKRREKDGKVAYKLDKVREAVGDEYIVFKSIPGGPGRQTTCFYATDNEDVYQFLMRLKKQNTGNWKHIVVEHPTRLVEINGQQVPATYAGAEAALAAIMAEPVPQE